MSSSNSDRIPTTTVVLIPVITVEPIPIVPTVLIELNLSKRNTSAELWCNTSQVEIVTVGVDGNQIHYYQ